MSYYPESYYPASEVDILRDRIEKLESIVRRHVGDWEYDDMGLKADRLAREVLCSSAVLKVKDALDA